MTQRSGRDPEPEPEPEQRTSVCVHDGRSPEPRGLTASAMSALHARKAADAVAHDDVALAGRVQWLRKGKGLVSRLTGARLVDAR
ncbi:MAG: hypothetical protein AAEC03_09300, partial [Synechococcus sp.]